MRGKGDIQKAIELYLRTEKRIFEAWNFWGGQLIFDAQENVSPVECCLSMPQEDFVQIKKRPVHCLILFHDIARYKKNYILCVML